MTALALVGCAALGLVAASTVWVLADQQIRGARLGGAPVCLECGSIRPWTTWLPLSTLFTRNSCRICTAADPPTRIFWEFGVAAYFLAVCLVDARGGVAIAFVGALPLLLILLIDIKCEAVFVGDCYAALGVGFVLALLDGPRQGVNAVAGMAIAGGVVIVFLILSRWVLRSMHLSFSPIGKSDIYIGLAVGAIVRADAVLPALLLAVVTAGAIGVGLPLVRSDFRGRVVPFGPFLLFGGLAAQLL